MKKLLFSGFLIFILLAVSFFISKKTNPQSIVDLLKSQKNIEGFLFEKKFNSSYLILNYWASWCPPCIAETPSLIKFVNTHKQFQLMAISQDSSTKDIEDFIKTFPGLRNENTEVIWDDSKELSRKMNVEKLPETFIYALRTHKVLKISGSTNWEDPELLTYIENYFSTPLDKDKL